MSDAGGKTVVEVQQSLDRVRGWLAGMTPAASFVIEDYPIGRKARGRCRLEVEHAAGKGWRRVKTTTDRRGAWCKPHKSTYEGGFALVVTHPEITAKGRGAAWLVVNERMVYLNYANCAMEILAEAPHYTRPRRHEERCRVVTRTIAPLGGEAPTREDTEHVWPADPASLCDAYDLWERGVARLTLDLIDWERGPHKAAV